MSGDELKRDILTAAVDRACLGERPMPRTREELEQRTHETRGDVARAADEVAHLLAPISVEYHSAATALLRSSHRDLQAQLSRLVYPGFVTRTPPSRLRDLPRYLKAARLRLERSTREPAKDRERSARIEPLFRRYLAEADAREKLGLFDAELERYRWLLEELRVSLFAQELKTSESVSPARLDEQWARVVLYAAGAPR
jgi:ATP-dependent helicase HrpA